MINEKGNITSLGLVFLLSIISIGSLAIIKKSNDIKRHKRTFQNFLCVKEANGLITSHKKMIELTNNIINLANLGQMVGLITNPAVTINAQRAKTLTQKTQDIYHLSFLKNIATLFNRSCLFTPNVAKTFYQTSAVVKLRRNKSGTVAKRRKEWGYSSGNKSNLIRSKMHLKAIKTQISFY